MINDVAISYSSAEVGRLEAVETILAGAGFSTWNDRQTDEIGPGSLRERRVTPGSNYQRAISSAIDHSACLLCLISEKWRSSDSCQEELQHAESQGKRVIALGDWGSVPDAAKERISEGDDRALIDAVHRGLELGRAHARLLVASEAEGGDGSGDEEPSQEDLRALAQADLTSLGLAMTGAMSQCMARAQRRHRTRARRNSALIGAALVTLAALATVALIARNDARRDQTRAAANRDRVESLAMATESGEAANSIAALALARQAVALDAGPETLAALRQALEQLGNGVEIRGLPLSSPNAVAVSDDGSLIAEIDADGALALIHADRAASARVLSASRADAGGVLDISPDDHTVLSTTRGDGSAEVIDVETGEVTAIAGTGDTAGVFFLTEDRALAISHGGEVTQFDPSDPHPTVEKLARLDAPVRAAALAGIDSKGEPRLATLLDRAVEVSDLSTPVQPWRVKLDVIQGPYRPGWETIRVCGDQLDLLTTDRPPEIATSYAIPYTVTAAGKVLRTGSLLHSFGMICLPDGHALALDSVYGPQPFPSGGPSLPALTEDSAQGSIYALASSDNGQWALAGTDGYLKVINLDSYGREFEVEKLESLAPAKSGAISVAGSEITAFNHAGPGRRIISEASGSSSARGAFFDPRFGTVIAVGDQLLALAAGRARPLADLGARIQEIGPGPGDSALVLFGRGRVAIVPLRPGQGRPRRLPMPADLRADGALPDALLQGSGTVVAAATNGRLDLLRIRDGSEIRGIQLRPGPVDLAPTDGTSFLAATSDGSLQLLDSASLTLRQSQEVLPAGPSVVISDPSAKLAAAFRIGGEAAVVTIPDLRVVTHPAVAPGLRSVVFADHAKKLFLGADIPYIDGSDRASITEWPICRLCLGSAAELERDAPELPGGRAATTRPTFRPSSPQPSRPE